ncbi:MAG: hypothetical protein KME64_14855 [Scytonematopsis contorta HA4267-MV1]|jgi:hypothetical protein|nr:hypothetical protein [Scytonematopsis contorta HA4267-MV1]
MTQNSNSPINKFTVDSLEDDPTVNNASFTIIDDLPVVSITAAPAFVTEASGTPEVLTISLSQPAPKGGLKLNLLSFDSDATSGDEDATTLNIANIESTQLNNGLGSVQTIFTIAEGATEAKLILTPKTDNLVEGPETNYFYLLKGEGYNVNSNLNQATTTLLDSTSGTPSQPDNSLPVVSITAAPAFVTEASGTPEVLTISLSQPAPKGGLKLNLLSFDSDATSGDEDATTLNIANIESTQLNNGLGSVQTIFTIAEGATEAKLILTPKTDNLVEGPEMSLKLIQKQALANSFKTLQD